MDKVLSHHGIKGQRWGIRRYQNEDGTRTEAGVKRYSVDPKSRESKQFRSKAGSGVLLKKNETEEALKYKNASTKVEKQQAFKDSKAAFKANKTTGQKVANVMVNGPFGSGLYNNLRAQGHSSGASAGAVAISHLLLPPIGTIAAYAITNKGYGATDAKQTAQNVSSKVKSTAKRRIYG